MDSVVISETVGLALKQEILAIAEESLKDRDIFKLAVSGGSLISLLSTVEQQLTDAANDSLCRWHIFFADERWCPVESGDSTLGEYRRNLGQLMSCVQCKEPYLTGATVQQGAHHYDQFLRQSGPMDLVILGVGPDGHTASLFPLPYASSINNNSIDAACIPVTAAPKPPPERISMTIEYLLSCRRILFVVTGPAKASIVREILVNKDNRLPPTQLLSKAKWLLDPAAAHLLPKDTRANHLMT